MEAKGATIVQIITTEDGSHSLFLPHLDETYHSRHGAVQESNHVFITNGLHYTAAQKKSLRLLEVGFGTGLNAFLTMQYAGTNNVHVHYTTLETAPLQKEVYQALNYASQDLPAEQSFLALHNAAWSHSSSINKNFTLEKKQISIQEFSSNADFDLVYYDAFGPPTQPEMWIADIFSKLYSLMSSGGVLVTYCAKGEVRRNMQAAGFAVERLPGPPGKREMLRATKPLS